MSARDLRELLLLGALWGGSFLFMRLGAADFGPLALVFLRVGGATLVLMPLLLLQQQRQRLGPALRQHWRAVALVGVLNSALPFVLFTTAALVLGTSLMAMFNATAPIWAALIAWGWLGERPGASRLLGLAVGVAGVVGLGWGQADLRDGAHGLSPALGMAACLVGALSYGLAANVSRRWLVGVPPLAAAGGSQAAAALLLAVPAVIWWPAVPPSTLAWASAAALAVACTGLAYVLYFRLIAHAGAANAMTVTLLVPAFAIAWGWIFLAEVPTAGTLAGCATVLLGTALSTGLLRLPAASRPT